MYVEKLEAAYLIPMLRGIKPLLGRHPCYGIPKKLLSIDNLKNFLGVSSLETMVEDCIEVPKKTKTEKPRSLSVPKVSAYEGTGYKTRGFSCIADQGGNEVSRQRDIALLAAVKALQEASTAERLLKCLRNELVYQSVSFSFPLTHDRYHTYSQLLKAKGNDQQLLVDKFFTLQDDLTNTRLILHSLKSIGQRRTADTDPNAPDAVGEALRLALDIKQNATSYTKASVASDLNSISDHNKS
ncbi:hypothetical protein POTOM_060798 [Populus tomentosa]|uniref:Uncharacterized protein n=1 Tax=Populus tomentosa TaxID=118781 RepID=A0A8X7XQE3_POPTO|nr:hypothetical protein POTOM_060798 [Populus tomentosa]